jgi:outer membrane protein OmpA-like peptidoglycan-associated protein
MKYFSVNINRIALALLLATLGFGASAQQSNTMYFMNNVPERNAYNPAFQPIHNVYIDIPIMPNFRFDFDLGLTVNDLIYRGNGSGYGNNRDSLYTILHPSSIAQGKKDDFLKSMDEIHRIYANATLNILGFGFRYNKGYITFGTALKMSGAGSLPKDFFKLAFNGPGIDGGVFNFGTLAAQVDVYMETSLGYSHVINEKVTVGGNLKYLVGLANLNTDISKMQLTTGIDEWRVDAGGRVNFSVPFMDVPRNADGSVEFDSLSNELNRIGDRLTTLSGTDVRNLFRNSGAAIDLGVTYVPIQNLQLSAAITDLGFIRWKQGTANLNLNGSYAFTGVEYTLGDSLNFLEPMVDTLLYAFNGSASSDAYTTFLSTRLNVGAEYSFNNKIGFGLLWSTLFTNKTAFTDLTASFNLRPTTWISWAFTYSLLQGRWSTLGFGAQLRIAPFNMYLAVDRIPLRYSNTRHFPSTVLPMGWSGTSLQAGMVWVFGDPEQVGDDDGDGVKNRRDKCPNTPLGDIVDKYGCSLDEDKDGIADNKDSCPGTPAGVPVDPQGCPYDEDHDGGPNYRDSCPHSPSGVTVDSIGCPFDTDNDGVPDYRDSCPGTPAGIAVDVNGCPLDEDKDGVPDYLDKCAATPAGVAVDSVGCPNDDDGDGIPNYRDSCPNTPVEARGYIDTKGCPLDSDKDGVPDYRDSCPNTPIGSKVDYDGCIVYSDSDGDGVSDNRDSCPNTPAAARDFVDRWGCPMDTDGDGIPDSLDNGPTTPIEARGYIDTKGCPLDSDNDGVPDYRDSCPNTPAEARNFIDRWGCPIDTDGDSIPDYLDNCPNIKGVKENFGCPEIKAAAKQLFEQALNGIQFQSGKDVIVKTSNSILDEIAQTILDNPDYILLIYGHTDNVGKPASNLLLSDRRAAAVKKYLVSAGVPADRMESKGFGDTKPIAPNTTTKGKAKNRRVELVVKFER